MSVVPQQQPMNPQQLGQALDQRLQQQMQPQLQMLQQPQQVQQPGPMLQQPVYQQPMYQQQPTMMPMQPQLYQQPGMMPAAMMAPPVVEPIALLVPARITLQDGRECTLYVQLPADAAQNPHGAVAGLMAAGYPIAAWRPKNQSGGQQRRNGW